MFSEASRKAPAMSSPALMQGPVNISKIIPPRSTRILPRTRLLERLEQQRDKKLLLILGQAAQGKSTLALTYVNASQLPSAWLNLGPEDTEAVSLFYVLVNSLQRALPGADLTPLLSYPSLAAGPREEIPLFRDWLLTLLQQVKTPVQVVFDGLDRLAPQAPAFRFLQVLLELAPPHLHFIMLSREMPPLKVQDLKIRQEAYILRNHDLAFTAKETRNFLLNVRKLQLPHDLIARLHEVTEGWIGGLVLLCETLEQLPEESRVAFLSKEFAEKFAEEVAEYFDEIIFAPRSPETREFLIKTSILEVVEPDFARDFIGADRAGEIMEKLSADNLFVQPLFDKQRGWLYRYHQLFKDFLQAKFKESLPAIQQAQAYYRAGCLLEERGDPESAVDYYLQAGKASQAAAAIERVGLQLLRKGKTAEVARWLQELPADLVQERPWLLLYRYLTERFSGSPEALFCLVRAHGLFKERQDLRGLLLTSANLLEISFYLRDQSLPLGAQISQAEEVLQRVDNRAFPCESATLWVQVGLAKHLSMEVRQAYQACRQAHLLAREAGEHFLEFQALNYAKVILSSLGEFRAAQETHQQVEALLGDWISPEVQVLHLVSTAMLMVLLGKVERQEMLVKLAQEQAEKAGLTFLYSIIAFHRYISLGYLGRYAEAAETGLNLLNLPSFPIVHQQGIIAMFLAIFSYHNGDLSAARQLTEKAREILVSETGSYDYYFSVVKITEGLISYHLGDLDPATEGELVETLHRMVDISSYLFMVDAHWVLGLWRRRQGRLEEAAGHIKSGMEIAAQRSSYHSIILSPGDRGRIFTLALELGVEEVWDSLPPLLASLAEWVEPDLERLSRHGNPRIAARAWELCRSLHRRQLPRLDINTLGEFRLQRHPGPEDGLVWEGKQSKLLLKALIARGGVKVPQEVLLEDLWPESPPGIADRNFRVSLHRLRRTLEPGLHKAFGSSYIHTENGLLSLDQELCRVDADEFLANYATGEGEEDRGNPKEALARYKQAVTLYGGDFLAEELYQGWVEKRRQELRGIYLDILERLSQLYEKHGTLTRAIDCCKKAIQVDPVLESAYRRLMSLYARRGLKSEALRTYETCKLALARELDTMPDPVTTAIYRKIKESV